MSGAPALVSLAGRPYWVLPLRLIDLGVCEAHLLAGRRPPLESALEVAPAVKERDPDTARRLVEEAFWETFRSPRWNKVGRGEFVKWLATPDGMALAARLRLRSETGRRLTARRIARVFKDADPPELRRLWDTLFMVSGLNLFGKVDWHSEPDDGKDQARDLPISWPTVYRRFGEEPYQFPPAVVSRMTLYQLHAYRCDEADLGGTRHNLSEEEAFTIRGRRLRERVGMQKELEEILAGLFGG